MLFLIPHLFPSRRLLESAATDLRLPALQTLLARGTRQPCPAEGVEAALCEALGIARQQDWPLAPITLKADGGTVGEAYWLRADPVHLQVMRDRIVLAGSDDLTLSREEADALVGTISQHFGDAMNLQPLHPQRWYLQFPMVPNLSTAPRTVAAGCDIAPWLPQGLDAKRLRAQLNELQMLLHAHPVNLTREARGELPVNSLWLWGGGCRPAACACTRPLYTLSVDTRALGTFCGTPLHTPPAQLDADLLETDGIVVLEGLTHAGQVGHAYGWREALRELEQNWFRPLQQALGRVSPQGLRLLDPVNGQALHLHARDAWRVWRRPRDLVTMLS